jgi:hypothetical protein
MLNKGPKLAKQKKPTPKVGKTKKLALMSWLLGVATLVGAPAAVLTFVPRPSVSVGDPVDPDNPFSSKFTVRNGNIPLTEVSVEITPRIVGTNNTTVTGGSWTREEWTQHRLGMDETFDITPGDVFSIGSDVSGNMPALRFPPDVSLQKAEISIIIEYYPWFIPLQRSKTFRYETHRQTNGKLYWYSVPLQ